MKTRIVLLLFLAGAGLIGWTGYDYSRSGSEVARFELSGTAGSSPLIELDPSLNPMRALLIVSYEIELMEMNNNAFDYNIVMTGPAGMQTFTAEGGQREKREDNTPEFVSKTSEQVIKTFDIPAPGDYLLDWRIMPGKAQVTAQAISLRQNVTPLRIPFLIAGVACFLLAFLYLLLGRKKRS